MTASAFRQGLLSGLALLGLALAPGLLVGCDANDGEEAYEELMDELGDARDEIEDEFDDRT